MASPVPELGVPSFGAQGRAYVDSPVLLRPEHPLAERRGCRWGCMYLQQAATTRPVLPGVFTGLGYA